MVMTELFKVIKSLYLYICLSLGNKLFILCMVYIYKYIGIIIIFIITRFIVLAKYIFSNKLLTTIIAQ